MRLHEDTIEAVKDRADIYEVVSDHVSLKKQGRDFVGLCPFHEEKSPSFSVSPSKQMFYCFGCGKGGNAISFLKEIGQQSFVDVVLGLAQRYNVPVKTLEPEKQEAFQRQQTRREQLYEIVAVAVNFYEYALRQGQGRAALNYLTNDRQFSETTLQQFQIGYAPPGWDTLYTYLVVQKYFPAELVEAAGLILPRKQGDGYYDRFRDRIMIPIHDDRGRAIGFGGRALGDEKPKYLNSPETDLFDKGKTLFCLDKAKSAIAKDDRAVVVEGYFDAIALHAAGIHTAVASLGTALSEAQVRQLLRYTESKQVVFNFDADAAGIKATNRAIGEVADLAYRGGVQLRILNIPEGKDADDFLKSASPEAYVALLNAAPLWIDWQIDRTIQERDLSQADGYQQATQDFIKLLQRIDNLSARSYYVNRCAEILAGGDARRVPTIAETLLTQVRRSRLPTQSETRQPIPAAAKLTGLDGDRALRLAAEEVLLRLYLHCPELREPTIAAVHYLDQLRVDDPVHNPANHSEPTPTFSLAHHLQLWRSLQEAIISGYGANPLPWLQDRYADEPDRLTAIAHLLYLNEKTAQDIQRGEIALRSAIAAIERILRQARYRRLLKEFETIDFAVNLDQARQYQQAIYTEKARIDYLDRQRCTEVDDLVRVAFDATTLRPLTPFS